MKKLSRRKFLKFLGIAGVGALASKITKEIEPVAESKPETLYAKNATFSWGKYGPRIPMDTGVYEFDFPELQEEAIQAPTVDKQSIFGKEFSITGVTTYPEDNWFYGPRIRYFPDKDSENYLEGWIEHVDPHYGVVTAVFPQDEWTKYLGLARESLDNKEEA